MNMTATVRVSWFICSWCYLKIEDILLSFLPLPGSDGDRTPYASSLGRAIVQGSRCAWCQRSLLAHVECRPSGPSGVMIQHAPLYSGPMALRIAPPVCRVLIQCTVGDHGLVMDCTEHRLFDGGRNSIDRPSAVAANPTSVRVAGPWSATVLHAKLSERCSVFGHLGTQYDAVSPILSWSSR